MSRSEMPFRSASAAMRASSPTRSFSFGSFSALIADARTRSRSRSTLIPNGDPPASAHKRLGRNKKYDDSEAP